VRSSGTLGRHQAGQVLVLFALSLFVLVAFAGLAIDGSRLFRARLGAQILADEAARIAAEQIDEVEVERQVDLVFLYVLGPQTVAAASIATPLAGLATARE
jgi:Flp pilus assembly protein TadG